MLEIGSSVGDDAQVGHSSSLNTGQTVPASEHVQGSPAHRTGVQFLSLTPMPRSTAREAGYTLFQLAAIFAVAIPSAIVLTELFITWLFVHNNAHAQGYDDFHIGPPSLHLDLLVFSALLNLAWLFVSLATVGIVPRVLGPFVRPDTAYPLFGLHYVAYQIASAASNSRTLNHLLGDSPFITAFLKFVGYAMPGFVQTGANFGLGFRLVQTQNATRVASATADRKLRASLSYRVAMRRKSFSLQKAASMRQRPLYRTSS